MSVTNGQPATQTTFNNAFGSKTSDNTLSGVQTLANTLPASGDQIDNAQRYINEIADADGTLGEGDTARKTYSSDNVVADGDSRKVAIGKLDAQFDPDPVTGHTHDGIDSPLIPSGFFLSDHDFTGGQAETALVAEDYDGDEYSSVQFFFEIVRGTTIFASGTLYLQYLNSTWRVAEGAYAGEEHGLTWDVDQVGTVGTLTVAASGGSDGTIKFKKVYFAA